MLACLLLLHGQILVEALDNGDIPAPLRYSTVLNIIIGKVLRPPTVDNLIFYLDENSPENFYVTQIAAKPRPGEALHFNITSGNTAGAFFVQECSGMLFVSNPVLNFEDSRYNFFNMSVVVVGEMVTNVTVIIYIKGV